MPGISAVVVAHRFSTNQEACDISGYRQMRTSFSHRPTPLVGRDCRFPIASKSPAWVRAEKDHHSEDTVAVGVGQHAAGEIGELVQVVVFVKITEGRIHEIGFEQAVADAVVAVLIAIDDGVGEVGFTPDLVV